MRSLFLRIFLWFWLVMVVVAAILIVSSPYWTRVRPAVSQWEQRVFARLAAEGERSADLLASEGADELGPDRRLGGRGGPGRPTHHYLFIDGAVEVFGQEPPEGGLELVGRCLASGETETDRTAFRFLLARPVEAADGERYALLLAAGGRGGHGGRGRPPNPVEILDAKVVLPRLAAVVIIVGALCYWLSRYLTSPLRRLRTAATGLAGGDLAVRVDPAVGSRRDEIGDLAREFDTMAERVQALVESRERLLRDVSHELRSPLARLDVALALAREDRGKQLIAHLDRIDMESSRLNHMIGQLATLTRLESGAEAGRNEVVDLALLVGEVVADASFEAHARGCTVSYEATACEIEGKPDLLRSAVENVVRNALRYTADDSEVEVALEVHGSRAEILVRDRGPGVPEESLQEIFQPFARVGDDRDRETGGVGLGLAIAERATRSHGGSVMARNAVGGGLEVILQFAARIAGDERPVESERKA